MRASAALLRLVACVTFTAMTSPALTAALSIASGAIGRDIVTLREQLDRFEHQTGHTVSIIEMPSSSSDQFAQYRLWLAARSADIDVYRTDIVWAPQLASHLLDLSAYNAVRDDIARHFPSIIATQTVNGRLVALPFFTDVPALYYRTDLLAKYRLPVPRTWAELAAAARTIQDGEREGGQSRFYGYVFPAAAYEGLTCVGLEWLASQGGGSIVEQDGAISVRNSRAVTALDQAARWISAITPTGVLGYREEESRGLWQIGRAAFMRNWPYAYALSDSDGSAVKGKFAVTPMPADNGISGATLGGWNLAVSKYSRDPEAAVELVLFLTSSQAQKERAIRDSALPTRPALYDDPDILAAQPVVGQWRDMLHSTISRPSAATGPKYNEVSKEFWEAVHATLSGRDDATHALLRLEARLKRLKGASWK